MIKRSLFILILVSNSLFAQERSWNTTPFDRIWNKVIHPMMYRDPIVMTPFNVRIGQFYWGGESYWKSFKLSNPMGTPESSGDFGIFLSNTQHKFPNLNNPSRRKGMFIEVEILKTNLTNLIYKQNFVDFQFGLGYRFNRMLSEVDLMPDWNDEDESIRGTLKFFPLFHDFNFNSSMSFQRSPHYLIYINHSFGYTRGSLFQSLGGDTYLDGNGVSESFGWGIKYIRKQAKSGYSFNWGIESRWSRIFIPKLNDPLAESYPGGDFSPIESIDIRAFGLYFTFSVNIGGVSTEGDKAFKSLINDNFATSAMEFETFLENYPDHSKKDKAEMMLDFCYKQIPYQRFREGLKELAQNKYNRAIKLFNKAQEDADEDLQFEINSRLAEISNTLLDSALYNYKIIGYDNSEKIVQKAVEISPKMRFRGDQVLAKMYFDQGNILFKIGNYDKALEKYSFAQQLDPELGNLLNVKRKDLASGFLKDASKATDVESIYLVIESLNNAIKMEPELEDEMKNIVKELEERLEEAERREVQEVVNNIVSIERKNKLEEWNIAKVELGLLPHEVENILGKPKYIDTIIDDFGIRFDMWSYPIETGAKRYYFENHLLIRIESD